MIEAIVFRAVIVAVVLIAGAAPGVRRQADVLDAEMRAVVPGADLERQFRRPRDEGRLL
jgi:hypothetical protein